MIIMKTIVLIGSLMFAAMVVCGQTNIQATSSDYSRSQGFSKGEWDGFELVLRMEKLTFKQGEPVRVFLIFRNRGTTPIKLDGIWPMRQSANPPMLKVTLPDGGLLRSYGDGVPKHLMTNQPIVVEPKKEVVLIDADLRSLSGAVHPPGGEGQQGTFKDKLGKGKYQIMGEFAPTPQNFCSRTNSLAFEIK